MDGTPWEDRVATWELERPSRTWERAHGSPWWGTVDVLQGEATEFFVDAVRPALEAMAIRVNTWPLVNERVARRVLSGEEPTSGDFLIVACHGDSNRLHYRLPVHAGSEDWGGTSYTTGELEDFLVVGNRPVISIGCLAGDGDMPGTFIRNGATSYTAPTGEPFSYSAAVFAANLFMLITHGLELTEAVDRIRGLDREFERWVTY